MKIYRRLLVYLKPYGRFVGPFFIFTLIGVFFSVFQFTLIIPLLNFLFNPDNTTDAQKYVASPHFHLSLEFIKDFFYYQVHRFKNTKPIYALYFLAGMIVIAVL